MELIVPFLAAIALCAGAALLLMRLWQGRRSGVSIRMQVFVTMAAVSGGFAALLGLIAVERLEHRSLRLAEEVAGEDAALVAYLLSAALSDRESRCGSAAVDPRSLDTIANSLTEPSLGALRPGLLRLELRDPQGRLVFQSVPPRLSHSRRHEAFAEGKAPLLLRGQPVGEVRITRASLGVTQILKEVASRAAVLSLLLVIGTAIAAALVGRAIAKPIERLTHAASRIAHGERQAVLPRPVGREVRTLTAAVESMRRELEGRHLAERLAMDLSHQLKNPVAAIRATAEVLADGALDEPVTARRFVGRIQEATERLLQLVNNLLALTRLQARGVEPELVDVSDLVRRCADAHAAQAERRRVHIDIQTVPGAQVRGDSAWLRRAIDNLVDNALAFATPSAPLGASESAQSPGDAASASPAAAPQRSSEAAPVRIRVWLADNQVNIEVQNHGPGIDPAVRERLFERFVTTRRDTGGSGLGLAIVAAVAEQHGGSAQVESAGPPVTTFLLRLPRASATLHQIFS